MIMVINIISLLVVEYKGPDIINIGTALSGKKSMFSIFTQKMISIAYN
jgi:hypothetical protein